jgi:hypothetical protein
MLGSITARPAGHPGDRPRRWRAAAGRGLLSGSHAAGVNGDNGREADAMGPRSLVPRSWSALGPPGWRVVAFPGRLMGVPAVGAVTILAV